MLVTTLKSNTSQRRTFALKRANSTWRVKFAADRGEEGTATCRHKRPGAAVAFDLGFRPPR